MRRIWSCLPALFVLPLVALAQQPAQPAATREQMLDHVLKSWEQSMTKLESFSASCSRATQDKTFGGVDVYEGTAKFLKSGPGQPSRALLMMADKKDPSKYVKYLYTGTFLYEYVPATKVLRVHDVPQPKSGQPAIDDSLVSLLFGMKAEDAKKRYQMTWVPDERDNNKYYHYIQILPRIAGDKADFTEARLALRSTSFLPAQVWYHQPNGNQTTWDFKDLQVNVPIPVQTFAPPSQLEKGWRLERVQQPAAQGPAGVTPKK
jgi:TIGR03009 family protein